MSLGVFSCSFVAFPLGKLQYHHLESFKTKTLTKAFGNFNVLLGIPNELLQEILWWKFKIAISFYSIIMPNPLILSSVDASLSIWGASDGKIGPLLNF